MTVDETIVNNRRVLGDRKNADNIQRGIPGKPAVTKRAPKVKSDKPRVSDPENGSVSTRGQLRRRRAEGESPRREAPAVRNSSSSDGSQARRYSREHEICAFDKARMDQPQCVAEYAGDIFRTLRGVENKYRVSENYFERQEDINEKMRTIMIDWLVEVALKFNIQDEALYLAVNLIDRYLAVKPVRRNALQLVGITCLFIAAKYEEIYPPELRDFCMITNDAYTDKQIIDMEMDILNALQFHVTVPSSLTFLKRFMAIAGIEKGTDVYELALMCLELTLPEYQVIAYSPSRLACASLFLAIRVLSMGEEPGADDLSRCWPRVLVQLTGETDRTIRPCTKLLVNFLVRSKGRATFKKYSRKGNKVASGQKVQSVVQA